jgi:hypothetical protein
VSKRKRGYKEEAYPKTLHELAEYLSLKLTAVYDLLRGTGNTYADRGARRFRPAAVNRRLKRIDRR